MCMHKKESFAQIKHKKAPGRLTKLSDPGPRLYARFSFRKTIAREIWDYQVAEPEPVFQARQIKEGIVDK